MSAAKGVTIPPVDITTLPDTDLSSTIIDLASRRLAVKAEIDSLTLDLDELSSQLLSTMMVNSLISLSGRSDNDIPFTCRISARTTKSLSIPKLMERGVTTDDLEYATEEKIGAKFVELRIVKEKEKKP